MSYNNYNEFQHFSLFPTKLYPFLRTHNCVHTIFMMVIKIKSCFKDFHFYEFAKNKLFGQRVGKTDDTRFRLRYIRLFFF